MSYEISMIFIAIIPIAAILIKSGLAKRWCDNCRKSTKYLSKKEKHICGKCKEKYKEL